ncbi:MAG: AmmeMemoRadiSam system radical SAM enzyme [Nitrospirae bacterium RIFCSPLOWO2_02_42_7]|nr:MAG: AmmeMemoRadiSam system radical SAM enzyme [Nitrospirae bacterium RIFCSPLOWO2_02_42_7]
MKEAYLYQKLEDNKVKCDLCAHRCFLTEGKTGICGVKKNINGTLYSLVYDKVVSANIDPIEKKPLFHFLPGSTSFSIATVGCNFRCLHCQNFEISQMPKEQKRIGGSEFSPEAVVTAAYQNGCDSISYTYTEPTIFFELAYDTAKLAHEKGIKNVFVTNGYMTEEALMMIRPYLDAANVDLKFFNEKMHKRVCGASRDPVLDTIRRMKALGIWIEVTTLIIPTKNDSDEELKQIAEFIKEVGIDIPWHVSAFHPTYKMLDLPRTSVATLKRARKIGIDSGLRYVYTGNIPGDEGEHTFCYNCKSVLIHRVGYEIIANHVRDSRCIYCGAIIDGVGIGTREYEKV